MNVVTYISIYIFYVLVVFKTYVHIEPNKKERFIFTHNVVSHKKKIVT